MYIYLISLVKNIFKEAPLLVHGFELHSDFVETHSTVEESTRTGIECEDGLVKLSELPGWKYISFCPLPSTESATRH